MATILSLICANPDCGKEFQRELGRVRSDTTNHYCSKSCLNKRKVISTDMIQEYLNGATMKALAVKYKVSPSTISNRLRKSEVPIRERSRPEMPQFKAPYHGYWNDWGNVKKHLRELVTLNEGVLPGRAGFISAGLDSLHGTIVKKWGGVRAVRKKLGLDGVKRCTVCKKLKNRTDDFRLKRRGDHHYYDSICKSCSSLNIESYRHTWEGRAAELVRRAKERASRFNLEFDIDQPWVFDRLVVIDFKCEVTGIPLSRGRKGSGVGFANRYAASLDRVDSSDGYTKNNVRIVCNRINTALGNLTDDQFEEFAMGFLKLRGFSMEKKL